MSCWHTVISSRDRATILPAEHLRQAAVHKLAAVAGNDLVIFGLVDDHLHWVTLGSRSRAGRIAQSVHCSLRPLAVTELQPSYFKPVNGRSHLLSLVRYLIDQPRHHGLSCHPALWTGSCFADIIGARYLPQLRLNIFEALPRLTRAQVFQMAEPPRVHRRPRWLSQAAFASVL